jgi:hypothetical protein
MQKDETVAIKRCHSFVVIPKSKYRPDKHVLYDRPKKNIAKADSNVSSAPEVKFKNYGFSSFKKEKGNIDEPKKDNKAVSADGK